MVLEVPNKDSGCLTVAIATQHIKSAAYGKHMSVPSDTLFDFAKDALALVHLHITQQFQCLGRLNNVTVHIRDTLMYHISPSNLLLVWLCFMVKLKSECSTHE